VFGNETHYIVQPRHLQLLYIILTSYYIMSDLALALVLVLVLLATESSTKA